MELPFSLLFLILATALACTYCANGEQLSTVFVLETSDSSQESPVSNDRESSSLTPNKTIEDSNTRVITDDESPQAAKFVAHKQHHDPQVAVHQNAAQSTHSNQQVIHKSAHSTHPPSVIPEVSQSTNLHQTHNQNHPSSTTSSSHKPTHNSSNTSAQPRPTEVQGSEQKPASRRLEEETQRHNNPVPTTRNNNNQQTESHPHRAARSTTTTTSAPYEGDSNYNPPESSSDAPKVEDRLLISITSDDDEYKPPPKQLVSSGNGYVPPDQGDDQQPQSSQLQVQQQPHKRKPSITISIQDANVNKQNGGSSGSPSVILRPSENGQSIVISTVGGSNLDSNNKYNTGVKPSSAIAAIVAAAGIGQNHNNNPNTYQPHREPVPGQHHQSTHRPTLINEHITLGPSVNRPITSTLIDPPRQPAYVSGERPQRPQVDHNYETRPTSRPTQDNGYGNSEYTRPVSPSSGSSSSQQESSEPKYPLNERNCGTVHETRIVGGDEADPDDFLWMAAIIKSKPTGDDVKPFCGGSLITRRHILTAAHCLENLAPRDVLVRLGSYDFDDSTASSLSQDFAIDQFRVPAQYSKKTHVADIAIMRLKTPLSLSDNYKTVCMPQPRRSYVGALGTVTGYGSQSQTFRKAAPKLRQVTVPIWENRKCSVVYKKNLTESFLCAGYEEGGKDACQGDSGGPLMTDGPNERMMIVGVVSHGIGCGSPGYPGVYTRTTTFLDWIEKNTKE